MSTLWGRPGDYAKVAHDHGFAWIIGVWCPWEGHQGSISQPNAVHYFELPLDIRRVTTTGYDNALCFLLTELFGLYTLESAPHGERMSH